MKQNEKGLVNRKSTIKKSIVFLLFITMAAGILSACGKKSGERILLRNG